MKQYRLTRLNDDLIKFGEKVVWIAYKPDGNSIYDEPDVGRGCLIFNSLFDSWQTTLVKSFFIEPDGTILFTTQNSDYKLEHYETR